LAVAILFMIRFSGSVANPSFPLIIEQIRGTRVNLNSVTGSIIASAALAGAVSAGLLGYFGDRWGHRRVLLTCSLASAAVALAHVMVWSIPTLLVIRIVFGFSVAGMIPAANVLIRQGIHQRDIGKAYGAAAALSMSALAAGPFLGGLLGKTVGLRVPFIVNAAGLLVVAVLTRLLVRSEYRGGSAGP